MRLEVEFTIDETKRLNFNYNHYISSAIYALIAEHNADYSQFLHEEGYRLGNKNFKLFVFSRLMPDKFKVEGSYMVIEEGKARLYINSPIDEFVNSLGNSLMKNGSMRIGQEEFEINNIYLKDDISNNYESNFISLSPIAVTTGVREEGRIKPLTVDIWESKFVENIKNNLLRKYFLVHGKLPQNMNIDIEFDERYANKNNRGHLINIRGISVKGYIAPFTLRCDPQVKKLAIDCGIGENNSIGMGYIREVGGNSNG